MSQSALRILVLGAQPTPADQLPVWLAEAAGGMLIEILAQALAPLHAARLIFAVHAADLRRHPMESVISLACRNIAGRVETLAVGGTTQGAACTALLAIDHIGADDELLVLSANEMLDIDYAATLSALRDRGLDGGTVVFPSLHPRYSYIRLDAQQRMTEAAEKHPISRHAAAGFSWFRRGSDFIAGTQDMIRNDASIGGMFFICPVFNELVLRGRNLGVVPMQAGQYHPLKTPAQLARFTAYAASGTKKLAPAR